LTTLEDVLPEIKRINESIESILADIKSNTSKDNRQTKEENKVKLKQIARYLNQLKDSLIPFYHVKPTGMGKIPIKSFKPAESNLPPLPKQKETKQTKLNLNR
tara:strand:- start:109 stop:417 length:309 start_codon:yes stop_codon:yes gene_type:complete